MGFVGNKVALRQVSLPALQTLLSVIIPPISHIHSSTEHGTIRPFEISVPRDPVSSTSATVRKVTGYWFDVQGLIHSRNDFCYI
jgi:hypothetical protein